MANVFDITSKLKNDGKPILVVRGERFSVNDDVATVYGVMETLGADNITERQKQEKVAGLLFGSSGANRLLDMGLSYDDYTTVLAAAVDIALHGEVSDNTAAGEAATPAMT